MLAALADAAGERIAKSKIWPGGARALANRLRRAATFLRQGGIAVDFAREGRERTRVVHLASVASADATNGVAAGNRAVRQARTMQDGADAEEEAEGARVRASSCPAARMDAADGADADPGSLSPVRDMDVTHWRNERAAIAEYDGGLSRQDAEALASAELRENFGRNGGA